MTIFGRISFLLIFLGYIYLFLLKKWGNGSLFRYAEKTEVKTEPDRDRGGPRPDRDRDRDLDRMVCQKSDRTGTAQP